MASNTRHQAAGSDIWFIYAHAVETAESTHDRVQAQPGMHTINFRCGAAVAGMTRIRSTLALMLFRITLRRGAVWTVQLGFK